MNDRWGKPPHPEKISVQHITVPGFVATVITAEPEIINPVFLLPDPLTLKHSSKGNGRKVHSLHKDSLVILKRDQISHVIAENYSYKTDSYYTILQMETEGISVQPSTEGVIDAFVVPICLERAKRAGIPVCEWEISQGYVPLPAIIYGLNYFATTADFVVVYDNEAAKKAVGHITNKGKYPFCYQKLKDNAEICQCTAIFGKTLGRNDAVAHIAEKIYALFSIPLLRMVWVKNGNDYALSSLSSARYSHLSEDERALLEAYISHQEFL